MTILDILIRYREGILAGLLVTLKMCAIIWSSGILVGGPLGIASNRWPKLLGLPLRLGTFVLSGLPVLVLLFWVHYPLQSILEVVVDPFYSATAVLGVINTLGVANLVRTSLGDFPSQYLVAARVCGLTPLESSLHIELPIVLRQLLAPILTLQIGMLQATLFASLISVEEIFRVAQRINAQVYRPIETYTALGFFFLAICLPLNGVANWLRRSATRDLSEN